MCSGCAKTRRVELTVTGETFHDRCAQDQDRHHLSGHHRRAAGLPVKNGPQISDIQLQIQSGSTSDIIRSLETSQINLGFIRNIGSLRFFSMANDEYLLAGAKDSRLAGLAEMGIEDQRDQKIISFSRQNSPTPNGILPRCLPNTSWYAISHIAATTPSL